ncbi:MAG: 6,7-dimethyl-8-ribityllumazine synthase [Planctomycetota bacterium]
MADSEIHPPALAVIVSRYNDAVTGPMRAGAIEAYAEAGHDAASLAVLDAPGAFELAPLSAAAARSGLYEGVLVLGCVIKGQTDHDKYINAAVADTVARIGAETGVPIAFGLLTVNTIEQALARSGGDKGNKGAEAMQALLDAVGAVRAISRAVDDDEPSAAQYELIHTRPDKAAEANA